MDAQRVASPEMAVLRLALRPAASATFDASPARSLHAALLRRLELVAPDLSQALHDAPDGASSSDHPWSISPLLGPLERVGGGLVARVGQTYSVRVAALLPQVALALEAALDPSHPLGGEPLALERVPFAIAREETRWERQATYGSLLTGATPRRRIGLEFLSPTGFRTSAGGLQPPTPRLCIGGYLRRWNAFSPVAMPEEAVLGYVEGFLQEVQSEVRPATVRLGRTSERGVVGRVEWMAGGGSPVLLRMVNALVDYAGYCGTGMKTAQGMGQTRRVG